MEGGGDYAIFMLGPDGHFVLWNFGAEFMTGYLARDLIGRHFSTLFETEGVKAGKPALALALAAERGRFEDTGWLVRKDGSRFWAKTLITSVMDDHGHVRGFAGGARSISEHAAGGQQQQDEGHLALLVEGVKDHALFMLDPEGRVATWNSGAKLTTGYYAEDILGEHLSRLYPGEDVQAGRPAAALELAATVGRYEEEGWRIRKDGSRFWANLVIRAVKEPNGRLLGYAGVSRDVSDKRLLLEQLERRALNDSVTGLANRVLLTERLCRALTRLQRHPNMVAVLFVDIDGLQIINERFGRDVGDQALCALGATLASVTRPEDTVARFGEAELVILCEHVKDGANAVTVADRIATAVKSPLSFQNRELLISVSIGVAITADALTAPERLIADAEAARYRAKQLGEHRYELFNSDPRPERNHRRDHEAELRQALERDEFRLFFQPVVDLRHGRTVGYEALLRWQHPERGLLLPGKFIGMAEETGFIVPLGAWVLEQACQQAARLCQEVPDTVSTMSINMSFGQVAQPDLAELVTRTLSDTGSPASRLCLELTENALMSDPDQALRSLEKLKTLGVKLAVDDFGTGYSSLSFLQRFSIDIVKIDRRLIAEVATRGAGSSIVEAMIRVGDVMGLGVVAEGVETADQQAALRALGCPSAQGFHFGRPAPGEDLFST